MPTDPLPASLDQSFDSAHLQLQAAAETLRLVGLWLGGLADDTRWESRAARGFHDAIDELGARAGALRARVLGVQWSVDRAHAVLARPW